MRTNVIQQRGAILHFEGDVVQPTFRRSLRCEGGCCVEVAVSPHSGRVLIRNSDGAGMLEFNRHDWAAFVMILKLGNPPFIQLAEASSL